MAPTLGRRLGSLPAGLGGLLLWVVATALTIIWIHTLGALFTRLGDFDLSIPHVIHKRPFGWLKTASNDIERWLNDAAKFGERGMVWGFTNFVMPFVLLGAAAFLLGQSIFELGEWTASYVRKALHAHVSTRVFPTVTKVVRTTVKVASQAIPKLTARVHALEHRLAHIIRASATAVAHPIPRIGRLEREIASQGKRVRRLEKALAAGVGAAFLVRALAKLGLSWIRCNNVKRAGKQLCGMNPDLLESLLGATLLLTSAISLRDLARELEAPTKEVTGAMSRLVREFGP